MVKTKYELPSSTFPYKIPKRLNILSVPRPYFVESEEGMPKLTRTGVRKSALKGSTSDRVHDAAYPIIRRLLLTRRANKKRFSQERMENLDRLIEAVNGTCYTKLANAVIDLKKFMVGANAEAPKDSKRRKSWNESEWKKHMDYINQIAGPRHEFQPPPCSVAIYVWEHKAQYARRDDRRQRTLRYGARLQPVAHTLAKSAKTAHVMGPDVFNRLPSERGEVRHLADIMPRILELSRVPLDKMYRRPSEENWYRDPLKVPKTALTYVISERVKKLAVPRKTADAGGD